MKIGKLLKIFRTKPMVCEKTMTGKRKSRAADFMDVAQNFTRWLSKRKARLEGYQTVLGVEARLTQ